MRIEKLDENRIRIFLNIADLEEKNIDLHTFMSNSLETQDLFLDMLNKAESELGFKTKNYNLTIEAIVSSEGNFIFTITRNKQNISQNKTKIKQPKVKRSTSVTNSILSIYCFNTFDDFCEFCNYLSKSNLQKDLNKFRNSSLILYKNTYYLILNSVKLKMEAIKNFSYAISEFASQVKNASLFDRKLKEYGKVIINKNAIDTCVKYFSEK